MKVERSVWMYCGETEGEAREAARNHMTEFGVSSVANYELNSDHFKDIKGYEHYAGAAAAFDDDRLDLLRREGTTGAPEAHHPEDAPPSEFECSGPRGRFAECKYRSLIRIGSL